MFCGVPSLEGVYWAQFESQVLRVTGRLHSRHITYQNATGLNWNDDASNIKNRPWVTILHIPGQRFLSVDVTQDTSFPDSLIRWYCEINEVSAWEYDESLSESEITTVAGERLRFVVDTEAIDALRKLTSIWRRKRSKTIWRRVSVFLVGRWLGH